jgi:uncharacterized protein (TIRG00374 family)
VDWLAVAEQLRHADYRYLGLAAAVLVAGLGTFATRWLILLGRKPTWLQAFHASNMGHAGNILIPFRAGEVIRVVAIGSTGRVSYTEGGSAVVAERLFEQGLRLLAVVLAVVLGAGLRISPLSIAGGVGVIVAAVLVIRWLIRHRDWTLSAGVALASKFPRVNAEGVRDSLTHFLDHMESVAQPGVFIPVLIWSFVSWALFYGFFYLTLQALPVGFPSLDEPAVAMGALALSPPSAPTQPGIFHASIVVPLAAVGYGATTLTAFAILLHIQEMIIMLGLGLWGMLAMGLSPGSLRQAGETPPR